MEVIMSKGYRRMNKPGGMNMMGQLQKLQEQIEAIQAQLAQETVTASVGGGVVKVTMSGDQRCQGVEISPEVFQEGDVEMLQDLMLSAVNSALEQSRQLAAERLGPLASGLPF